MDQLPNFSGFSRFDGSVDVSTIQADVSALRPPAARSVRTGRPGGDPQGRKPSQAPSCFPGSGAPTK